MSSGGLRIGLFDPGMTPLHRAGLAGLWMTLDKLARDASESDLRSRATWTLSRTSVEIAWEQDGQRFLEDLCRYAYPITEEGLMSLAVLGDPMVRLAEVHTLHTVLLDTFLQHPKSRHAEKGKPTGRVTAEIEGHQVTFTFRRVEDHRLRWAPFPLDKLHEVSGWLLPGAVVRHYIHTSTALAEPPTRALALRFAPIGSLSYLIRHQSTERRLASRSSLVVPDIRELETYADLRRSGEASTLRDLHTAGPAEAALRFFGSEAAIDAQRHAGVPGCQVMDFARMPWSSQQMTRAAVLTMPDVPLDTRRRYRAIWRALRPRWVQSSDGRAWIDVPQVPEQAAENLLVGRPWWTDFASWTADPVRRRHIFQYEQEGLATMLDDETVTPDAYERAFVRACHEAWRSRLGELSERARRERLDRFRLFDAERERLRASLARCKTPADLSAHITDFWARAGSLPTLQRRWPDLLPFLDARRWRTGRDLALLALASYRSEQRPVPTAPDVTPQEQEGE